MSRLSPSGFALRVTEPPSQAAAPMQGVGLGSARPYVVTEADA